MPEWWTYSLSDFVLFSPATYYRLFALHNAAWWPGQLLALPLAAALVLLARRPPAWAPRAAALLLAACWAWVAWAYHLQHYASINWAATWLAGAFAAQALLLAWSALARGGLRLRVPVDAAACVGYGVAALALLAWPLIPLATGRPWAQAEVFGFAPDPTALATLGLAAAAARPPRLLLAIPLLWCAASGTLLWTMGSAEALAAPALALAALGAAAWRRRPDAAKRG